MAIAREAPPAIVSQRPRTEKRPLNAQQVTLIAVAFLKSLGHKKSIKPKRVFLENQRYIVEAQISSKRTVKVQIDPNSSEIKEYEISQKVEESPITLPVEPKAILLMFVISFTVSILGALLNLQGIFGGLF